MILRRYTNIPSLLHILQSRTITLLDPKKWDDSNDSYGLEAYRKKKKLKSVLALCFSQRSETYHHWHVFAEGAGGVCIHFHRDKLLRVFESQGVLHGEVNYVTLPRLQDNAITLKTLPFSKRAGYSDEDEYRAIYESPSKKASHDMEIPLDVIDRVTLSPWLHDSLLKTTQNILRAIQGCERLKVTKSSLISNRQWKDAIDRV
jgi:hypothetical protein